MIEINNTTKSKIDETLIQEVARIVLGEENKAGADLSIAFVGEKRMQYLNKRYRKKDKITNVLSFEEPEFGLGEIVICLAEVRREAKKYGITWEERLAWVLMHGILHLLSYDHEVSQKETEKMNQKEQFYLSLLSQ